MKTTFTWQGLPLKISYLICLYLFTGIYLSINSDRFTDTCRDVTASESKGVAPKESLDSGVFDQRQNIKISNARAFVREEGHGTSQI